MPKVHALVPVKTFTSAKSRLAPVRSPDERATLARRMAEHVLGVLGRCRRVATITVVTPGEDVVDWAEGLGARVLRDVGTATRLGDVVDHALARLAAEGAGAALVVMSDLPNLDPESIDRMIDELAGADVVVAPDVDGLGTNALAMAPPTRMPTCFGNVDSAPRHRDSAVKHGLRVVDVCSPGLGRDVDVPEDLSSLGR